MQGNHANKRKFEWPIRLGGRRVTGPEVEFDAATRKALHEQLDAIDRAQLVALAEARWYVVRRG